MILLLVQSSCPWCLKRLTLKTSVFGIRKGLLIEKAPTEKMGALILLKWILRKYRVQASCRSVNGRANGRGYFCKTQALSGIPLMICLSEAGAISLKALGSRQAWTRENPGDLSISLCYKINKQSSGQYIKIM